MNINQAREQIRVAERAQRLFQDGYTLAIGETEAKPEPRHITTPAGVTYIVDPLLKTCTCPYFQSRNEGRKPEDDQIPCKHLLGWEKLEADQEEEAMWRDVAERNGIDWE